MVFFDTTSIYFEGEGRETIGQRGHSKDHRPDLKQMIVGAVPDGQGRPICCELWPGNTADVTTLLPVVDRLRSRFGIGRVCIVADRGMISKETIEALENQQRGWQYILGARMRSQTEVKDEVLARAGRYRVVHPPRVQSDDPSPLKVKEVWVEERRYIVCLVFCSFLALVLRPELEARLVRDGHDFEWADVIQDLDRLQMVEYVSVQMLTLQEVAAVYCRSDPQSRRAAVELAEIQQAVQRDTNFPAP